MPDFTSRGHRLHYTEAGEGPLMVILPGNTSSAAMHKADLDHFSDRFHVVVLDYLGTGKSDRLAHWPDSWWEDNALDAAELIHQLGEGPAILLGSSGGGIVALGMAFRNSDVVRGVIAESCAAKYPGERLLEMVERRKSPRKELIGFWTMAHGGDWQQVVEADTDLLSRVAHRGGRDYYEGRLNEITCPVLLAGSLKDTTVSEIHKQLPEMARAIPQSELLLVNDGEHPLIWTNPEVFYSAADSFLARRYRELRNR